jgi:uncharacterized protein (DUF1778 family)
MLKSSDAKPCEGGMIMNVTTEERGRITARVSQSIVERLQEAAEFTGATLNQFLIQAALEKADKIIEKEKTIHLSLDAVAMLINMLENPSKPNAALTMAFERYRNREENGTLCNRTGNST